MVTRLRAIVAFLALSLACWAGPSYAMPAPTNTTEATATNIASLPYSISQTVDFGGTTYTVWYKYTAVSGDDVLGVLGFGDLTTYIPTTTVWTETSPGVYTQYFGVSGTNLAITFPITVGTTYYFKFTTNGGNPTPANLTGYVDVAPNQTLTSGSLFVNDDNPGFPAAILSSANGDDYHHLGFVSPFPAGEGGDILLSDGTMLFEDEANSNLKLYDASFNTLATVSFNINNNRIRACQEQNTFYAGNRTGPASIQQVLSDGSLGTLHTLPLNGLQSFAPSNDESIIYNVGQGGAVGTTGLAIKQWITATSSMGSDLVAGTANYIIVDMLVLADDTIVALYFKGSAPRDIFVKIYDAGGSTLATYTIATAGSSTSPRLAFALDNPNSFWQVSFSKH
jgi:hypothetical protein